MPNANSTASPGVVAPIAPVVRSQSAGILHQRALKAAYRPNRPAVGPTPADLVSANLRRLERLERYGLVTRLARGCWRIPGDLVAQLEARERTHPRHHVQVERLEPVRQLGRKRGPEMSR